MRQSGPDSGLDFQTKVLKTFEGVPSSLGSGYPTISDLEFGETALVSASLYRQPSMTT